VVRSKLSVRHHNKGEIYIVIGARWMEMMGRLRDCKKEIERNKKKKANRGQRPEKKG